MEPLLQSKLHSAIRLKTFVNHSMNLSDTDLRKMLTKSIRQEDDIASEDKQDAIEYFYKLLKKSRWIMQQENMQELMNFIQATLKLDNDEIIKKIDEELSDKLDKNQISEFKEQVLEIKASLESGQIPD